MRRKYLLLTLLLCLFSAALTGAARDRDAAREAYRKADLYHQDLMNKPAAERSRSQYLNSITLYRKVIDNDPSYGACDDALYTIAALYDEMAERYASSSYRKKAIYYYEFVAREYPSTKFRGTALERAGELRRGPAVKAAAKPAQPDVPAVSPDVPPAILSDVRFWSNEDYTRVVLQLDKETEFHKEVLANPDRIFFDLLNTRMDRRLINRSYDVNGLFINQIRVGVNRPGVVRVVLDFDKINEHTVFALYNPFRIVIDTRGPEDKKPSSEPAENASGSLDEVPPAEPEPDLPATPGATPTQDGRMTLTRTLGLKVGKVVIDPGHGGKDPGVVGPTGLQEKDLVLDVGLKLRDFLVERLGVEVVMTRDRDVFVPLEERTAIANQIGADLFISIHANGSPNRRVRGIETFVLDFSSNEDERRVASLENAGSQRTIAALEDLLRSIARGDYKQESRDLATIVQSRLHENLSKSLTGQTNRGVKQAPFIVLIGSNMPSILTEVGFISNPSDEKYYRADSSRNLLAESLYTGVENYFQSLGNFQTAYRATSTGN